MRGARRGDPPALLHFDLWDGNVLGGPGGLTGLVDGERWLFGDPLMDLVSSALLRRIEREPDHPFLVGYGPVDIDSRRLGLYRVHLALLMLVEMPSRRMTDPARFRRLTEHLEAELAELVALLRPDGPLRSRRAPPARSRTAPR